MVVEDNRRSTWRHPFREHRDAPLGGHCGETTELEGRGPIIDIPAHLSGHPNGIGEGEQIYLEARRKKVGTYDNTWPWGFTQLHGSTKSRNVRGRPIVGKDKVCIFIVGQDEMKMGWCLSTPGSPAYILRVTPEQCTWRPWSSNIDEALEGWDRLNWEMHLEAVIDRV